MRKQARNEKSKFARHVIRKTSIPGILIIERPVFKDVRGFFKEVVRLNELEKETGIKFNFKQWSHSFSRSRVIRGFHAENWNKIIYPVTGKMFAALVDIRPKLKSFGRVETFTFDEAAHQALFIPKGVANSVCVFGKKPVHYLYIIDAYYDGSDVTAVAWDDPDLAVNWPVKNPIISERDRNNPTLREMFPEKFRNK